MKTRPSPGLVAATAAACAAIAVAIVVSVRAGGDAPPPPAERPGLLVVVSVKVGDEPPGHVVPEVVAPSIGPVFVRAEKPGELPAYWEAPAGARAREAVDRIVRLLESLPGDTVRTLAPFPQARQVTAVWVPPEGPRRLLAVRYETDPGQFAELVSLGERLRASVGQTGRWLPISSYEVHLRPVASAADTLAPTWPADYPVPSPLEQGARHAVLHGDGSAFGRFERGWFTFDDRVYEARLRPILPNDAAVREALGEPVR